MPDAGAAPVRGLSSCALNAIERIGNRLPDPTLLFVAGAAAVMGLSQIAAWLDWQVAKTVVRDGKRFTEPVQAVGLLSGDGLYWAISSLVKNFIEFPALGVVLVAMLGIGVAEKSGAITAMLKAVLALAPQRLLTPAMVLVGILSSITLDAGYVVLPPIAAALYRSVGRSPLVGLAAVFAGVSAGFSANLVITGLDPMLAGLSTSGARLLEADYEVAATCNLWFMIASTVVLSLVGWAVTAWFVEPRYAGQTPEEGGPATPLSADDGAQQLRDSEVRGLAAGGLTLGLVIAGFVALAVIPGAPLAGEGAHFDRWVHAFVPVLFFAFLLPGVAYGVAAGTVRGQADVAGMMAAP